jgi:hypothetical protein
MLEIAVLKTDIPPIPPCPKPRDLGCQEGKGYEPQKDCEAFETEGGPEIVHWLEEVFRSDGVGDD